MAPICYHTSLRQRSNCFSIIYNSHPSKCHRHDYDDGYDDYDDDYDEDYENGYKDYDDDCEDGY